MLYYFPFFLCFFLFTGSWNSDGFNHIYVSYVQGFCLLIEKWINSLGCCRNAQTTCNSHAGRFKLSVCSCYIYLEMVHRYVRTLLCQSNIYVSWSTLVRLVPSNMFQPSSKFLTEHYNFVLLLWTLFIICV